jgi:HEAT repeat protein
MFQRTLPQAARPCWRCGLAALLFSCLLPALSQAQFLGKGADEWLRQLKSESDARQRRNAAFALGKMGNRAADALPALGTTLARERDPAAREAIVFAIGEICRESVQANGDSSMEDLLCGVLQARDETPLVRRSAAYALGCLGTPTAKAQAALEAALGDQDGIVRQNVAWALGQFRESALPALAKALHDNDPLVQRDAAGALLQMKDNDKVRKLIPDLVPLCAAKNSEVRRAGLNVLVRIVEREDKEAIPALKELLEDRDVEIQRNAALALSNIGGKQAAIAVPVLLTTLRSTSDDVDLRRNAAAGLGNLGPDAAAAVPELVKLLRADKDIEVRCFAALSLGNIGAVNDEVVTNLVDRVRDKAEAAKVRAGCATALNYIGAKEPDKTRAAIGPLLPVLQDAGDEIDVRSRVIWALRPNHPVLPNVDGAFNAFGTVMKEPRNGVNNMLRYDCAFMLSMIWKDKAPDTTLDVLSEFLKDSGIKIFDKSTVSVGGIGAETAGGRAVATDLGRGDGRIMATQALEELGKARWRGRADIVQQLRTLAADATLDPALRQSAQKLVAMAN